MSNMRFQWTDHENVLDSSIHVEEPLFDCHSPAMEGIGNTGSWPMAIFGSYSKPRELESRELELLQSLTNIRGVDQISIHRYQVAVRRALVFDWAEIKPKVEMRIAEWAGHEGVVESKQRVKQ